MSTFRTYAYLRASTKEQDAGRAKDALLLFAKEHDLSISAFFEENESGATLQRPELFRLLEIAQKGDIVLVDQIDRISRLKDDDWYSLKSIIKAKGLRVVSLDLPTSHQFAVVSDEFTGRMLSAINDLMLDMLAAIARKDYEDRRRRQKEGIVKAKSEGRYLGRPSDVALQLKIEGLLSDKKSYDYIQHILGCSRTTISKVSKRLKHGCSVGTGIKDL
jgi:DNA invertase Pin-like site-specific DNA recombinase